MVCVCVCVRWCFSRLRVKSCWRGTWLSKIFISWSSSWRSVCQWNLLLAPISCLPPLSSILKSDHWLMLMVLFRLPHILTACLASVFAVVWFQTNCQCVLKGKHVGSLTELTFQASCCPFLPMCVCVFSSSIVRSPFPGVVLETGDAAAGQQLQKAQGTLTANTSRFTYALHSNINKITKIKILFPNFTSTFSIK